MYNLYEGGLGAGEGVQKACFRTRSTFLYIQSISEADLKIILMKNMSLNLLSLSFNYGK